MKTTTETQTQKPTMSIADQALGKAEAKAKKREQQLAAQEAKLAQCPTINQIVYLPATKKRYEGLLAKPAYKRAYTLACFVVNRMLTIKGSALLIRNPRGGKSAALHTLIDKTAHNYWLNTQEWLFVDKQDRIHLTKAGLNIAEASITGSLPKGQTAYHTTMPLVKAYVEALKTGIATIPAETAGADDTKLVMSTSKTQLTV